MMYKIGFIVVILFLSSCGGNSDQTPDNRTHIISTAAGEGGSITPQSAEFSSGEAITFTLNVDEGYVIGDVTGCDGTLEGQNYLVDQLDDDCLITANFSLNRRYQIESVTSIGGNIQPPSAEVLHNQSIDFAIAPHTDHEIDDVAGCEGELDSDVYTLEPVMGDCTVHVNFTSRLPEVTPPLTRIRIPVVVHVLQREDMSDVTDEEIVSQIEATNQHFRKFNPEEIASLPDEIQPYVGDMGIQFYLADTDPQGAIHTGIVRIETRTSVFDPEYLFAQPEFGGSAPWPTDRYINIWVGDFKNRNNEIAFAGRAHVATLAPDNYIGVSVEEGTFGVISPTDLRFSQGKTLTHELGHFFGLIGHTHNDESPSNTHAHLTCDGRQETRCKNSDLTNNFMNVEQRDDGMRMFSLSQQHVMREWLENGPLQALYLNNL